MKFKLLRGKHAEGGKVYKPGALIDSKTDLAKKHGANKYLRLSQEEELAREIKEEVSSETDEEALDDEEADLHSLTLKELHEIAEEREINLEGATRKDDIVKILLRAKGGN